MSGDDIAVNRDANSGFPPRPDAGQEQACIGQACIGQEGTGASGASIPMASRPARRLRERARAR
jgi:hypothetical protein